MARFTETLDSIGAEGYAGDMRADLTSAYDEDIAGVTSEGATAILALETERDTLLATLGERDVEIARLQGENAALLEAIPSADADDNAENSGEHEPDGLDAYDRLYESMTAKDDN